MEIRLDVGAVLEHFGGITPLCDKLNKAGFSTNRKTIEKWKERDSIPTGSWLQIEFLAESSGALSALKKKAIVKEGVVREKKNTHEFSKKELLDFYTDMLNIRRFEEKAGQLYGMGLIGGFCHLYIGQEAIAVGLKAVMEKGDSIITTYRDHGLMLSSGSDPEVILGELMGRENGCSKGKGGSMHMFDLENRFYGGHGIVGASAPLGTGIAFAHKYKGEKNICMTYFGDGAVNQGQVYEAFNMASLWKLPVIYVIENNEYAMGTSVKRSSAVTELYQRGISFNIPGKQVDGMNIFEVISEGKKAIDFVRAGNGPIILEMKTYRYRGHSMSDPAKYRSKEEVEQVKELRDPIENLKKFILSYKKATEDELKEIDKKIRENVTKVAEKCGSTPEPDVSELWTDVYI